MVTTAAAFLNRAAFFLPDSGRAPPMPSPSSFLIQAAAAPLFVIICESPKIAFFYISKVCRFFRLIQAAAALIFFISLNSLK